MSVAVLEAKLRNWRAHLTPVQRRWLRTAGIILFYTLLTVIVTWPVPIRLSSVLAGTDTGDQFVKTWSLWNTRRAILAGENPAQAPTLLYPNGYFSTTRSAQLMLYLLALPLELLLAPVTTYNLLFLLSFILTGCGGYLLTRDLVEDDRAALLGGLVMMLFPLRVAHVVDGHLEFGTLFLALVFMRTLRRTLLRPSVPRAVVSGILLAAAITMHLTVLPYVLLGWTLIYVTVFLIRYAPRLFDGPTWRALLITAGVGLVFTLPFYIPFLLRAAVPPDYLVGGGTSYFSADLLSAVSPSPRHPLLVALNAVPAYAKAAVSGQWQEVTAYLGLVPVLLAGLAVFSRKKESGIWLVLVLLGIVMALGPFLKVAGNMVTYHLEGNESLVTLPYVALSRLPYFELGRTPGRFNILSGLALGVLAGQGADILLQKGRGWRIGLAGAAVFLVMEYTQVWPMDTRSASLPKSLQVLEQEDPDGAVLNIPAGLHGASRDAMYYQIFHHWPIIGGYIDRSLPAEVGKLELLNWLAISPEEADIVPRYDAESGRQILQSLDVRYVVLHRQLANPLEQVEDNLANMLGDPLAHDARTSLYHVGAQDGDMDLTYGLADMAADNLDRIGWFPISEWQGEPARWLSQQGDVVIFAPEATQGALHFRALVGDHARRLTVTVNGETYPSIVVAQYMDYTLPDLTLEQGFNVITFKSEESCWQFEGDDDCWINRKLAQVPSDLDACWLADPGPSVCVDALFQDIRFEAEGETSFTPVGVKLGENIALSGYQLETAQTAPEESLPLTLVWQVTGTPPEDYVVFAHVLDASTGSLIAQYDAPPLNEGYPTSEWQPDEIVQEQIRINIPADAPPGDYVLLVGMYTLPDVVRLPVLAERQFADSGLLYLQDVTVVEP